MTDFWGILLASLGGWAGYRCCQIGYEGTEIACPACSYGHGDFQLNTFPKGIRGLNNL